MRIGRMVMGTKYATIVVLLVSLGACQTYTDATPDDDALDAQLFALEPLPKVHYYWPPAAELLEDKQSRRLYELVRITHTFCVSGEWTNERQIDNAVYTCTRLNKTNPPIKASVGVNFSPWHRRFDKALPPTDRGPTYSEEIRYFEERAVFVKQALSRYNQVYGSDVAVGAVLLDCERFEAKAGDPAWNKGMREALDAIHRKAQEVFPDATIIWYGRGMIQHPRKDTWHKTRYWTGEEIKSPLTCSLYGVPEIERMRAVFRKTVELADQKGISQVIPYVALASGYERGPTGHTWRFDWQYDPKLSLQMGAELNDPLYSQDPQKYAPYDRAGIIVFYPRPFDKRTPDWGRHFIAYVKGATVGSQSKQP